MSTSSAGPGMPPPNWASRSSAGCPGGAPPIRAGWRDAWRWPRSKPTRPWNSDSPPAIPDARRMHGANMFGVRYDTGRLAEFAALAGRRRVSDPLSSALFALTFGELGRPEEARVFIEDLHPDGLSAIPEACSGCTFSPGSQKHAPGSGDTDRAAVLYDLLAPHRGNHGQHIRRHQRRGRPPPRPPRRHPRTARRRAGDHFAAAARIHAAFPAPTLLARTRLEWARMLLTRGQSADAARCAATCSSRPWVPPGTSVSAASSDKPSHCFRSIADGSGSTSRTPALSG